MTSVAVEVAPTVRISDPRPSHCAACFRGAEADVRFVDFDAAIDRGSFVGPGGVLTGAIDDLHLCEACVQQGAEAIAYKAQLHRRQLNEIRKKELQVDHWRDTAERQRQENERLREYIAQLEHIQGGRKD